MRKSAFVFLLVPLLLFSNLHVSADEKKERTWEDEIIYSLMVDRFYNGNSENDQDIDLKNPDQAYQGGDFAGIVKKLDYLNDLGFTAIQLSPIFENEAGGFHGEWVKDFYKPDPHFGTMKEFKQLVKEAHARDMKVIVEFETNHVGKNHPWTKEVDKQSWLKGEEDKGDPSNIWEEGLPELNHENSEVKTYLLDAAKWWMDETDIDGYYFSGMEKAPMPFWEEMAAELKEKKAAFYLTGSVHDVQETDMSRYQEAGITGIKDKRLSQSIRDAFSNVNVSTKSLFESWRKSKDEFGEPGALAISLDDKSTQRFTKDIVDNKQYPGSRWKLALFYMYTQPEVPVVFYASEIAVNEGGPPASIPLMNFRSDKELMEFVTEIGRVRKEEPALTRGSMKLLYEKEGMTVFKREYEGDILVSAINNTKKDQTVTISAEQLKEGKELRGLFASDLVKSEDGEYTITVNRDMMEVYKLSDQSGYNLPFILALFAVFGLFAIFMYIAWRRGKKRDPYAGKKPKV